MHADAAVNASLPLLSHLCGELLLLLSVAVLTVVIERCRWWLLWLRGRSRRERLPPADPAAVAAWRESVRQRLDDWELEMGWGEPLLQAATLLAPLLGLLGTVTGLIVVLSQLGPRLELPAAANLASYARVLLSTAAGLLVSLIASAGLLASQGLRQWQISRLRRLLREGGGDGR